jgi:hypothetical protein
MEKKMRTTLISSVIILGLASEAFATCRPAADIEMLLREFYSMTGDKIGADFQASTQNFTPEHRLNVSHPRLTPYVEGLVLQAHETGKHTICNYNHGNDTIFSYLLEKK